MPVFLLNTAVETFYTLAEIALSLSYISSQNDSFSLKRITAVRQRKMLLSNSSLPIIKTNSGEGHCYCKNKAKQNKFQSWQW